MQHAHFLTPLALSLMLCHLPARADDLVLQRVLIDGARASQLGIADSANAGSVNQKQLEMRTVYRPGELLEAAPGLVATQHSGEGKANQFFLRGFNLDHGTDLRTTVDDMPVNQRSHAHGQGWTDLNFLIPELAARLDYRKGPYSARDGDFASAGAAAITYANRLAQSAASASIGQNGFARALLAGSPEAGAGNLLYALEVLHNDGPFTRPDDYRKVNAVLRYSQGYANNGFSIGAMAYRASWNATDQIPRRAVDDGTLGRFDAIDDSDGGQARRYSVSGVWRRTGADQASKVSAYVIRNQLELYSNFTYFLNDPLNGDQFSQPDRRVTSGVDATHTWHGHGTGINTDLTVGLQLQNDNIFNGLYNTRRRERLSTTREDHVAETSLGLFAEHQVRWSEKLRSVAGLRADTYRFAVRNEGGAARARDRQLGPSLNLIFGPWAQTEWYLNAGNGFHSNDARGTLDRLAPAPGLARTRGLEAGVRSELLPKLQSALSLYRLDIDSELVFVGDAGNTEAGPASRRTGIELSNYYKPFKWLSLDLDLAFAKARTRGAAAGEERIAGAVEGVGQFALTLERGRWSGALRLRYVGARPLIEDNSVRAPGGSTMNGRIGYRLAGGLLLEIEGFNLANRRASAIAYFYASRLPGDSEARQDVHFHPTESRSLRLTLVKKW
ncbi:TonB-dependent receptor plug domain-containing protein [Massilia sp. CCM 8695]|uniref:TonB-dependent receptor plug domain-containing protein n=1 Tax=Massilia frigida TaxID=2609281 RepID=A0ABX0N0N8_9BURK|nr:TonB-dependent receptor [Massilia frigida]NHZ78843.1 TonB-dependent receptor plug domain-containing protein [Massilia frigida]